MRIASNYVNQKINFCSKKNRKSLEPIEQAIKKLTEHYGLKDVNAARRILTEAVVSQAERLHPDFTPENAIYDAAVEKSKIVLANPRRYANYINEHSK